MATLVKWGCNNILFKLVLSFKQYLRCAGLISKPFVMLLNKIYKQNAIYIASGTVDI